MNQNHSPSPSDRGFPRGQAVAALTSGGVESAALIVDGLAAGAHVHPLFVGCGLRWEAAELDHLRRFLAGLACPALAPLVVLSVPAEDLYAGHWSCQPAAPVPVADSPDERMFLPGRNPLLLTKSWLWCHLHGVPWLALGALGSNPFPDATPEFLADFSRLLGRAVNGRVEILRPYAQTTKAEVLWRLGGVPWALTFSCCDPQAGQHCGRCNKCGERQQAFVAAGLADPTAYMSADVRPGTQHCTSAALQANGDQRLCQPAGEKRDD